MRHGPSRTRWLRAAPRRTALAATAAVSTNRYHLRLLTSLLLLVALACGGRSSVPPPVAQEGVDKDRNVGNIKEQRDTDENKADDNAKIFRKVR